MTKLDKVSNATNCKSKSTLRIYPTETETETDTETATKSGRANDQQSVEKSKERARARERTVKRGGTIKLNE